MDNTTGVLTQAPQSPTLTGCPASNIGENLENSGMRTGLSPDKALTGQVPFCDSTRTPTSTFVLRECVPSLFPELAKPLVPAILQSDQSRELPQRKGHRT